MTALKVDKELLGIRDIAASLSISHPTAYQLVREHEVRSFMIGRRRMYPIEEFRRLVDAIKRGGGYQPTANSNTAA